MKLTNITLEVLKKCQDKRASYIVGGCLRDQYLNVEPTDIDISTEMSILELKEIFPQLNWTEKGFEFGVSRMVYKGVNFEFSSHEQGSLLKKMNQRDFTINSLYHDGVTLFNEYGGLESLNARIITPLEAPENHFISHPQAYLRALRLSSMLGFTISNELLTFMKNNHSIFFENKTNRIQNEGYKILSSPYPLYAFHYLMEIGFLKKVEFDFKQEIPFYLDNIPIRSTYLSSIVGINNLEKFVDLFELAHNILEKCHYFYQFLDDEVLPQKPTTINQVLLLKKYQYGNNIEFIRNYLLKVNKKN